jgi:hypothetical protein
VGDGTMTVWQLLCCSLPAVVNMTALVTGRERDCLKRLAAHAVVPSPLNVD